MTEEPGDHGTTVLRKVFGEAAPQAEIQLFSMAGKVVWARLWPCRGSEVSSGRCWRDGQTSEVREDSAGGPVSP